MNPEQAAAMFAYNTWANQRVLLKAAHLTEAELATPAALSQGNILGDLVHIVDTQWYWREGVQTGNLPVKTLGSGDFESLAALRQRWEQEDRLLEAYVQSLSQFSLESMVTITWPRARPRSRPLWQILMHIYTHGVHHRSEIGRHLATLGQSPGDLDFIRFVGRQKHSQKTAVEDDR